MEACKEKVKSLETLRDGLQEQIKLLKDSNTKLTNEKEKLQQQNLNFLENYEKLEKENFEILSEFKERTNNEFEKILKEKAKFELENMKLKEEIENSGMGYKENHPQTTTKIESQQPEGSSLGTQSGIDYKQLYEDLRNEFEEFKNSKNLISEKFLSNLKNSYQNNEEDLLNELYEITQQNNFLIVETKKFEIDLSKQRKEIEQLHNSNFKLKTHNEEEIKKVKILELEKASLIEQIEKIKKDLNFFKESKEVEKSFKNKEIEKLFEEISTNKNEITKLKEESKEMKKSEIEKNQEIQKLKAEIQKEENRIFKLKEIEANQNESLKSLSENFEKILSKYEKSEKENLNLKEQNEILRGEKLKSEFEQKNFAREFEEIKKQKMCALEKAQSELKLANEELEKTKIKETEIVNLNNENKTLTKTNESLQMKIEQFSSVQENIQKQFQLLHQVITEYIHKYNILANEDLDSLLTSNFSRKFSELDTHLSQNERERLELVDIFQINKSCFEFIKALACEFEYCYEKFIEANLIIKETNKKVTNLENTILLHTEKENKLRQNLDSIQEEKAKIEELNKQYKEERKDLGEEINLLKIERENLLKTLKEAKNENFLKTQTIKKLEEDYEKIYIRFIHNETELNSYIIKNEILNQDRSFIESILIQFAKFYPDKRIAKNLSEIVNSCQFIFRTENEKLKIEEKLRLMEKEYNSSNTCANTNTNTNTSISNSHCNLLNRDSNSDLAEIVKNEMNNMRSLINNFNKKIAEKKETVKKLEKEIQSMQLEFRNSRREYGGNILHTAAGPSDHNNGEYLYCQRFNTEGCNKIKTETDERNGNFNNVNNINNFNNLNNFNIAPINKIELLSFDSNPLSLLEEKNNNLAILQLTDYNSLELDYSIQASPKKNEGGISNNKGINVENLVNYDTRLNSFNKANHTNFRSNSIKCYNRTRMIESQSNSQYYQKKERNFSLNPRNINNDLDVLNTNSNENEKIENEKAAIPKAIANSFSVKRREELRKESISSLKRISRNNVDINELT